MYYGLDKEYEYTNLAEAALAREQELFYYDLNIDNYKFALEKLPKDPWPDHLLQYKNNDHSTINLDVIEEVGIYQYRDHLEVLIKTNNVEKLKCKLIYDALLDKIPVEIREQYFKNAYQKFQNQLINSNKS